MYFATPRSKRCIIWNDRLFFISSIRYISSYRTATASVWFWMNEWMRHLYSALCIAIHPKRFTIMWGGSLFNHHQCAAATAATAQQHQCAHHTPATGGEEREIEPIKWMGIIGRPWLTRASGGNLARTPTLYEKCHGIFSDHRESGPRFNVSSEGWPQGERPLLASLTPLPTAT